MAHILDLKLGSLLGDDGSLVRLRDGRHSCWVLLVIESSVLERRKVCMRTKERQRDDAGLLKTWQRTQ
jgi:hypothetical protein